MPRVKWRKLKMGRVSVTGTSLAIFLPPQRLEQLGWRKGTRYTVYVSEDGSRLLIVREDADGAAVVDAVPLEVEVPVG